MSDLREYPPTHAHASVHTAVMCTHTNTNAYKRQTHMHMLTRTHIRKRGGWGDLLEQTPWEPVRALVSLRRALGLQTSPELRCAGTSRREDRSLSQGMRAPLSIFPYHPRASMKSLGPNVRKRGRWAIDLPSSGLHFSIGGMGTTAPDVPARKNV